MTTRSTVALSFFSLLFMVSIAQGRDNRSGKAIFDDKCAKCHGVDGTKGRWGAKNLQKSNLNDMELLKVVTEGKSIMPSWKKRLSEAELRLVTGYVKTLRK